MVQLLIRARSEEGRAPGLEKQSPQPEPGASHLAIARRHYRLAMHSLQPWQFHLLQAAGDGEPLSRCVQAAAQASGRPVDEVLADAMLWLPLASAAGLIETT